MFEDVDYVVVTANLAAAGVLEEPETDLGKNLLGMLLAVSLLIGASCVYDMAFGYRAPNSSVVQSFQASVGLH